MDNVLIFVEIKGNEPRKVSLELLSEGIKMEATGKFTVEALCMGNLPETAKNMILGYTGKLVHLTGAALTQYTPEGYTGALCTYAKEAGSRIVLAGATRIGRDFLPRVAVSLQAGIVSDITEARWNDDPMTFMRPVFGGKVLTEVVSTDPTMVVTARPNSFGVGIPRETPGEFLQKEINILPDRIKTRVVGVETAVTNRVDLTEADLIVAGGRGLKAAENFKLLEDLADVIGATVGATRSVVDAKWRDQADQIGKSGKTVSPKLYIGAGISGAIHHIMGMDTSKVILAINNDPNAIIFNYADYGIAGDAFEVLPSLTDEIRKRLGR